MTLLVRSSRDFQTDFMKQNLDVFVPRWLWLAMAVLESPMLAMPTRVPSSANFRFRRANCGHCSTGKLWNRNEAIELLILNLGDALAAFTWLGRLQNVSLEGLLERRRVEVKASSFCIKCSGVQPADCLRVLRELASEPSPENPLLDLPVEKVSDLGPHFKLLNEEQQRQARGDWFQLAALRKYIGGLEGHRIVDTLF
jgi:hypothetical protein